MILTLPASDILTELRLRDTLQSCHRKWSCTCHLRTGAIIRKDETKVERIRGQSRNTGAWKLQLGAFKGRKEPREPQEWILSPKQTRATVSMSEWRDFLIRGSQAHAKRSKTLSDKSHLKHSVPLAPWKHHGSIMSHGNVRSIHITSVNISGGKLWPAISTATKQQQQQWWRKLYRLK